LEKTKVIFLIYFFTVLFNFYNVARTKKLL
jgi:hypothetical protein